MKRETSTVVMGMVMMPMPMPMPMPRFAFFSPWHQRAHRTADIIWKQRPGATECLASLREIDLYAMEGHVKSELSGVIGQAYESWKRTPSEFCVSERYPVRELWYRASLAWQSMLTAADSADEDEDNDNDNDNDEGSCERPLVVAHNAVNQALLCVALGLPASYFRHAGAGSPCRLVSSHLISSHLISSRRAPLPRRFVQSNGGISCLDFIPDRPLPVIDRLNQSPDSPLSARLTCPRLILVRAGATELSENGVLMGMIDEPLSQVGAKQAVSANHATRDAAADQTRLAVRCARCAYRCCWASRPSRKSSTLRWRAPGPQRSSPTSTRTR